MLIINPIAGTANKRGLRESIEKRVRSMGHRIETRETHAAGDATELARQAVCDGFDAVLACGGDGTVNEVATGLVNTNVALGILPNGSGNGLARHIDLPVDPLLALKVVKRGHTIDCDYCTVNGIPFFCTFGLGFDAAVSQRFAASHRRGLITYLKSALNEFIRFTPEKYSLSIDGKSLDINAFLIACCNSSQYGNNAFIAPSASITDGVLDVTVVHSGNALSHAMVGVELLAGSIAQGGLVDTFQTPHLRITRPSPGIAHIDGEPVELPAELDIICHHASLKIFADKRQTRFRPLLTPIALFWKDCFVKIFKRVPNA